jgi:hypothetical protein
MSERIQRLFSLGPGNVCGKILKQKSSIRTGSDPDRALKRKAQNENRRIAER